MKKQRSIPERIIHSLAIIWLIIVMVFINQPSIAELGNEYRQFGETNTIETHLIKEMAFTTEIDIDNEPIYKAFVFPRDVKEIFCCFYLQDLSCNNVQLRWYYIIPELDEPLLHVHKLNPVDVGWHAVSLSIDDLPDNFHGKWPRWGCYVVLEIDGDIAGVISFLINEY